ncbi:MAG: YHYH protein [Planctomycetes bacterium]|nr:YHYH protein [Planctomycetota bacterium]
MRRALCLSLIAAVPDVALAAQDPELGAWRQNLDGTKGRSDDAGIHASVSQFDADVTDAVFTNQHVYVDGEGIPSHKIGPWPNNPNTATGRDWTWRIPRSPRPSNNPVETGLGAIGTMVNGVPFFNAKDGRSYRNRRVWEQDAIYWEGLSLDVGLGHPQMSGDYHYHSRPTLLSEQLGDNGLPREHSPILGFAFDGYPVYGPIGFTNPDGTGGLKRMESSYTLRNITRRRVLPDGTRLSQSDYGPDVSAQYPLGCYVQDFKLVAGSGDLDEHNGRFGITPEYPQGTYAYFMTVDENLEPAYPYLIGPRYYGVVDTVNTGPGGGRANPPGTATDYDPFSIYANDVEAGGTGQVTIGNAEPFATIILAWSIAGAGPTPSPWGDVSLSYPIRQVNPLSADANGKVTLGITIPLSLATQTIFAQALQQGSSPELSLPARVYVP